MGRMALQTLLPDYDVVKVLVDKGAMTDILGTDLKSRIDYCKYYYEELEQLPTILFGFAVLQDQVV